MVTPRRPEAPRADGRPVTEEEFELARRSLIEAVSPKRSDGDDDAAFGGDHGYSAALDAGRASPFVGLRTPQPQPARAGTPVALTPRASAAADEARRRVFEALRTLASRLAEARDVLRPEEQEQLYQIRAAALALDSPSLQAPSAGVQTHVAALSDIQGRLAQLYCLKLAVHDICVTLWAGDSVPTVERAVETGYTAVEAVNQQLPMPAEDGAGADATVVARRIDLMAFASTLEVHASARRLERLCTQLMQGGWPTEEHMKQEGQGRTGASPASRRADVPASSPPSAVRSTPALLPMDGPRGKSVNRWMDFTGTHVARTPAADAAAADQAEQEQEQEDAQLEYLREQTQKQKSPAGVRASPGKALGGRAALQELRKARQEMRIGKTVQQWMDVTHTTDVATRHGEEGAEDAPALTTLPALELEPESEPEPEPEPELPLPSGIPLPSLTLFQYAFAAGALYWALRRHDRWDGWDGESALRHASRILWREFAPDK